MLAIFPAQNVTSMPVPWQIYSPLRKIVIFVIRRMTFIMEGMGSIAQPVIIQPLGKMQISTTAVPTSRSQADMQMLIAVNVIRMELIRGYPQPALTAIKTRYSMWGHLAMNARFVIPSMLGTLLGLTFRILSRGWRKAELEFVMAAPPAANAILLQCSNIPAMPVIRAVLRVEKAGMIS